MQEEITNDRRWQQCCFRISFSISPANTPEIIEMQIVAYGPWQ